MQKNKIKIAILVILMLVSFSIAVVGAMTLWQGEPPAISHRQINAISLVYQPVGEGSDIRFSLDGYTWAG